MARQHEAPAPRRWLSGSGSLEWRADERGLASLLDALTRDRIEAEAVEAERQATSRRSLAELQQDQERAARDELAEARRELDTFRAAIEDARGRGGSDGGAEVPYRNTEPSEDRMADVLIQYLVRPGYAEVRTDEIGAGQYVYYVRVDWQRLRELAEAIGHPLSI
ncbi:MAG: hypothetical protein JOZ81_02515 [Chloroflexi bacterium]|nr:hypothetical protein [Chloroflexota bacterium]